MQKKRKLGRGVAVVGAGMSKFGMFKNKDSKDLFAEAFREMLESVDKGFDPNDIDALYLGNFSNDFFMHQGHWGPIISDLIGLAQNRLQEQKGHVLRVLSHSERGCLPLPQGFMILCWSVA